MEGMNRSDATLKKLDGAITKKRRRNCATAANNCSASAEPVAVRRKTIQPVIIHTVLSPPVIHAEPSTFMRIVQNLTGCPETCLRCEDEEATAATAGGANTGTGAGLPMSWVDAKPIGSPCSSMSSASTTITATTDYAASADEENLDRNAGPSHEIIAENGVNLEWRDIQDPVASPSSSCRSLLWHSVKPNVFFVDSGPEASSAASMEEPLCNFAESSDDVFLSHASPEDLESTLDSFLEHLLSSYDRDAPYCRLTSTPSALLVDVCDPMLLKELS